MNLHYSQTVVCSFSCTSMFVYHMNLHYSQTNRWVNGYIVRFVYHMNLHYSQTGDRVVFSVLPFVYHMNLHYSQTGRCSDPWYGKVCLPYEFTLLSNLKSRSSHQVNIQLQYGQILYGFFIMANFHQKHKRPYQ